MSRFAVTVVGSDRPGIVAEIADVLLTHEANIEDSQMSVLGGYFTVMLMVDTPQSTEIKTLRSELEAAGQRVGLDSVTVQPVKEQHTTTESSHTVTVYGADHPGIVQSVARALADNGISIVDLSTRVLTREEEPLYIMVLEVMKLTGELSTSELESALEATKSEQSVNISINQIDDEPL